MGLTIKNADKAPIIDLADYGTVDIELKNSALELNLKIPKLPSLPAYLVHERTLAQAMYATDGLQSAYVMRLLSIFSRRLPREEQIKQGDIDAINEAMSLATEQEQREFYMVLTSKVFELNNALQIEDKASDDDPKAKAVKRKKLN